jgi:hypothetical protein
MAGSGWLTRPLESARRKARGIGGIIHQFLWRRSRAVITRVRDLAARGDEKPLRVESSNAGWFRAGANRSYPEGKGLLLCASTERTALAAPGTGFAKRKTPKGGTK